MSNNTSAGFSRVAAATASSLLTAYLHGAKISLFLPRL